MAYPSPSCLCCRPTLHFPSVCHVNVVVPTLDMAHPSPRCLCSRPTFHFPSDGKLCCPYVRHGLSFSKFSL
jgi:hypothetical protein